MTDLTLTRAPSLFASIARAFGGFVAYVGEVHEAMNDARAQSARYSGSQW